MKKANYDKKSQDVKLVRPCRFLTSLGGEGGTSGEATSSIGRTTAVQPNATPLSQHKLPARAKELKILQLLSTCHERIVNEIGTLVGDEQIKPSGLVRNARTSTRQGKPNPQVTEIYSSPIDVSKTQISPSDPIDVLHADLTPTQERYIDAQRKLESLRQYPRTDEQHVQLTLRHDQVDRLVKALAESPLLQVHVRKQWWDDIADDGSVISESTPSLSSGSGSASSAPSSGTLYSQVNVPFLTEQRSPSVVQAIVEEEFARDFPTCANAKKPTVPVTNRKFGGIILTDPKVHGSPVRFLSKNYHHGAKELQAGACSFVNIPYGTSVQSDLRIEPSLSANDTCKVLLQVVSQILERKTGKKTCLLVAEIDVTESFIKAAITELAALAYMSSRDIKIISSSMAKSKNLGGEQIDWCALADELEMSCAVTDVIELAVASFGRLSSASCTMQTLTLMSQLDRIKTQHQDFMVLRPSGYHDNGTPSGIHIPWTSQHLDQKLYDVDVSMRGEASNVARLLREQLIGAVIDRFAAGVPFDSRIIWDGQIRMIQAVPLLEGKTDRGSRPAAWACFLSGIQDAWFKRH